MSATRDEFKAALFAQESSSGKADTSKPNYAGAYGPMQIIAPTFDALKNKGIIPNSWDINDPKQSQEAGNRLADYLYDKYGGNTDKAGAAFYAGEKAVRPDGSIANFKDKKNPNAPDVLGYIAALNKRLGGTPESVDLPAVDPASGEEPIHRANVLDSWTEGMPDRRLAARVPKEIADRAVAPIQGSVPITGAGVQPLAEALKVQQDADVADREKKAATPALSVLGAAFRQNTFTGAVVIAQAMKQYEEENKPTPGYKIDPKDLAGYTEDEQDYLSEAGSSDQLNRRKFDVQERRDDLAMVSSHGTGAGIFASIFAGAPEGALVGLGAAKAFKLAQIGSSTYAAEGQLGKALASSYAENAVGNVALTAAQQQFDPYVSSSDYAMGFGFAALGTALHGISLKSEWKAGNLYRDATRIQDEAAVRIKAVQDEAIRNLGPEASQDQLIAEAQRIEANNVRDGLNSIQSSPTPEAQVMKTPDDAHRIDVPTEPPEPLPPKNDKPFRERLDDALKEFGINVERGDRSEFHGFATTGSAMRKIILKDLPEDEFMKMHGNSSDDVLAHEFGHAITENIQASGPTNYLFKGPQGKALKAEMLNMSQEFRPGAWELQPQHTNKQGELLADASAMWIKHPDRRAEWPLFNDLLTKQADTKPLVEHFGWLDPDMHPAAAVKAEIANDPTAKATGISLVPLETSTQQAEAKALIDIYQRATGEEAPKVDATRLSTMMNTAVFKGAQSTANTLLRSVNPVARWISAKLLENPSGAAGRNATAAIHKQMKYQGYLGNVLNEVQNEYTKYRNRVGGSAAGDVFNGRNWGQFNRLVAEEMESRLPGRAKIQSPDSVKNAADSLEKAYERMRKDQVENKTVGFASLPESSTGYMPHRMSPEKIRSATLGQLDALHSALADQFIQIEGFDHTFSDKLASSYIDRIQRRGLGGFSAPTGIHQVGAADIVEDALTAMGMNPVQVRSMMERYMAGGPGHTKRRLQMDLSADHSTENGSFKLMDLFETDQFKLLRAQANRVSGEVALAQHGVMGKSGLNLLRRAMEFGADGQRLMKDDPAIHAFDQVAAEFLGDSFGTQSKFVDRVMQANSVARLGGMGFTQFGENINGLFHVGALRTLDSISSMGRLRGEILALVRGEKVNNPILDSLEHFAGNGSEFGTEAYKTVFPFDNQSLEYHTYGKDTINALDRLLRGGQHLQGKLSMWRAIHSTQQRGFAEQIVRKSAQYLKDGTNDVALRDMGITDELMAKLKGDLPNIAQFDGASKLTNFDITKASDAKAAEEYVQAIHRGVSQIIQGSFIGERGAWAHDPIMRIMTQFRTFSLTSVEKQWARQRGNVGSAKAIGMMVGSMSIAGPIYMLRTYLASIGRPDQADYLEKQLSAFQIARASLNYIALSGMAGDFMDATTALTGTGQMTGGRSGATSDFVGNMVAPSLGTANDVWKALQNSKDGTDPHDLLKAAPFSRLPWLIPAVNALGN